MSIIGASALVAVGIIAINSRTRQPQRMKEGIVDRNGDQAFRYTSFICQ
ncbi:hypothetical protein ABRT01_13250 [Lentibacillus sp. L22]